MLMELDRKQREALEALAAAGDRDSVERWRIAWLGSNGALKGLMDGLKGLSKEEKPAAGKRLNELKKFLEEAFEQRKSMVGAGEASGPRIDLTEPGLPAGEGRRHILSRTIDEITDVFARMGFSVAEGPEVEDEWHNFTALNIPADHPAREAGDNFFLAEASGHQGIEASRGVESRQGSGDGRSMLMLRSQTSTVQIRAMEKQRPPAPLKVIAVGRVYRPDTHDATHYSMFHQVEGLCVDKGVTMADLKTTLVQFARAYFGEGAEVRTRPSFFPFTEPSAEVDMKMKIKGEYQWVELGGCGMVDPNVFTAVGYDPEEWTGFAFGLGIERIAMRRYGIPDIRLLFENDARFLRQF